MSRKPKKFYKKAKPEISEKKLIPKKNKKDKSFKEDTRAAAKQLPKKETEPQVSPKKNRPIAEQKEKQHIFFRAVLLLLIGMLSLLGIVFVLGQIKVQYAELEKKEMAKKQLEATYAHLEEMAIMYPGSPDIYLQLASISYQLNNKEKARAFMERALLLDPNDKRALKLKAKLK